jgi:hypothetical protein
VHVVLVKAVVWNVLEKLFEAIYCTMALAAGRERKISQLDRTRSLGKLT